MMAGRKIKSQAPNRNNSLFSTNAFHITDQLCFDLIKDVSGSQKKDK